MAVPGTNLPSNLTIMRKSLPLLGVVLGAAFLATGCAGPEKKLGRGFNNFGEIVRWGETRRAVEQAGVWRGHHAGSGQGFVSGFNKSISRIAVGAYEIVTFPLPSYDPIFTSYLPPTPSHPDNYKPGLPDDTMFHTDTNLGFSGGDVMPLSPGSRFTVLGAH